MFSKMNIYWSLFLLFSMMFGEIIYANIEGQCKASPAIAGKAKWDLQGFINQEYKKLGEKAPNWKSPSFEEDYTYSDEWKKIIARFYDLFAKKYNIPTEWFLAKAFKKQDWALFWDMRGQANLCGIANNWLQLAKKIESNYPEVAEWIVKKIKNPTQRMRLPASDMQSDLETLFEEHEDIEPFRFDIYNKDMDFTAQVIWYAKLLKESLKQELKKKKE